MGLFREKGRKTKEGETPKPEPEPEMSERAALSRPD
jgi:hypothetical protein